MKKIKIKVEDPPRRKHMVFSGGSVLADIMKDRYGWCTVCAKFKKQLLLLLWPTSSSLICWALTYQRRNINSFIHLITFSDYSPFRTYYSYNNSQMFYSSHIIFYFLLLWLFFPFLSFLSFCLFSVIITDQNFGWQKLNMMNRDCEKY